MKIINIFWFLTFLVVTLFGAFEFIFQILIPLGRITWDWIYDNIICVIKHERQRKEAIERYKSENPIFKDDLPEDKR